MNNVDKAKAEFLKLAHQLEEQLSQGREFLVSDVICRLEAGQEASPNRVASALQQSLEGVARKNPLAMIRQAEIQEVVASGMNAGSDMESFREDYSDLLVDAADPRTAPSMSGSVLNAGIGAEQLDLKATSAYDLSGIFDKVASNRLFLNSGRMAIAMELEDFGFTGVSVETAAANDEFAVFAAQVDTPTGKSQFFVPAEVKKGSVLMPSVFYGNDFHDFTASDIVGWAKESSASDVTAPTLLGKLARLTGKVATATAPTGQDWSVELTHSPVTMTTEELNETSPVIPSAEIDPMAALAAGHLGGAAFEQIMLEATCGFSKQVIASAKTALASEIEGADVAHDAIIFVAPMENGMVLGTHLISNAGKKFITVPVEVANDRPLFPSIFASEDRVRSFDTKTLSAFASENHSSIKAQFSTRNDWTFAELHSQTLRSIASGDTSGAEENMAVILERFGPEHHKAVFEDAMAIVRRANEPAPLDKGSFEAYIQRFEAEAPNVDRNIVMMQNIRMINLD